METIEMLQLTDDLVAITSAAPSNKDPDRVRLLVKKNGSNVINRFFKGETSHDDAIRFAEHYANMMNPGRFIA